MLKCEVLVASDAAIELSARAKRMQALSASGMGGLSCGAVTSVLIVFESF